MTSGIGTTSSRLAQDRRKWKSHEEAYLQWKDTGWWEGEKEWYILSR